MPAFLGIGPGNPIAWCNFHRKGGLKTLLTTAGAYFGILAGLILLSTRLDPRDAARAYAAWAGGLLGLQILFTVIIGAGRVSATIRGDVNSGMLESLRMMPLPAGHAVAGYLSATAASLSGFFVANLLLGLVVNALAELPAQRWIGANLVLLAFALFVWTVAAFLAFLIKSGGAVLVVVSMVGVFGNVGLLYAAPGLGVLAGPLLGGTIFDPRGMPADLTTPLALSFAAQFLVAATFFAGAARKYRRPDALALGGWLGLALLLLVIGVSLLAILLPDSFTLLMVRREFGRTDPAVPFSGSAIVALLVALVPLCNFARLHVDWTRGRADDPDLLRNAPPLVPAGLLVTAALGLIAFALPTPREPQRLACIAAALFGFSLSAVFAAAWAYRVVDSAKIILAIWLACYCFAPLVVDFVRVAAQDHRYGDPALAVASTFSPVGLLIESATQPDADLRAGAVFHLLIPLLPAALYARATRRQARLPQPATSN
jgi:hypothetical protein